MKTQRQDGGTEGLRGTGPPRNLLDDEGGTIDVLVLWTKNAECRRNGLSRGCTLTEDTKDTMHAMAQLAVEETNVAFDNSGVNTQFRLVHSYRDDNYTEASDDAFGAALDGVRYTSDGVMDDVHELRRQFGADMVHLVIDDGQYCGIGYRPHWPTYDLMFAVSSWSCVTGYYTFGHEAGHNLGCNHDRGTKSACNIYLDRYNYGWRDPQGQFRDILAYQCRQHQCDNQTSTNCPKGQFFSNPNFLYNDRAMGDATSDCARRINDVRATVAAFESFVPGCASNDECDDQDPCTIDVCDGICYNTPMDCDNGDLCTSATCSGGECFYTDNSDRCDDGNPCTNDSCSSTEGCINTPDGNNFCTDSNSCTFDTCNGITGICEHELKPERCCGNAICERFEEECIEDCSEGPFSIMGPGCSSCYVRAGHTFDVQAKDLDVSINGVGIFYSSGGVGEVWTKAASHESSDGEWTKIAEHDFSGSDRWEIQSFPMLSQPVRIKAGETQAFHIIIPDGRMLFPLGTSTSTVAMENEHLSIYEGPTMTTLLASGWSAYPWQGEMSYITHTVPPDCAVDSECNDDDLCTIDTCDDLGYCQHDPIDCDDGNLCTEDTCSNGACLHTDISCDDNNPCTNDSCVASEGCVYTPDASNTCSDGDVCTNDVCTELGICDSVAITTGCCGNDICEPGEDSSICPQDCFSGPFTLPAPRCSRCYIASGHMFNVEAKGRDIAIVSAKLFFYSGTKAEVWTKEGTYLGSDRNQNDWTFVAEHDFTGTRSFTIAEFPKFANPVTIPAGETQAFYITLQGDGRTLFNYDGTGSSSTITAQDDHLIIYQGSPKVYQFGYSYASSQWSGELVYVTL